MRDKENRKRCTGSIRARVWLVSLLAFFGCLPSGNAADASPSSKDVIAKPIRLSYTNPERCLQLLQTFGYATGKAGSPMNVKKLPYIIAMPESKNQYLPNPKNQKFPLTETDSMQQLMVFFDARNPEQYGEVLKKVRESIDVPARQIMIEAMVLEISSGALADLGVQWDLDRSALSNGNWLNKHTTGTLRIGNLVLPNGDALKDGTVDMTFSDVFRRFQV